MKGIDVARLGLRSAMLSRVCGVEKVLARNPASIRRSTGLR